MAYDLRLILHRLYANWPNVDLEFFGSLKANLGIGHALAILASAAEPVRIRWYSQGADGWYRQIDGRHCGPVYLYRAGVGAFAREVPPELADRFTRIF